MEVNKINVAVVGQTKNSFIIPDGYSDEGKIENGLREGEHTIQDENGFRYALLEYRKDKLNGTCSFYDKGRLRKRATYVNDVINGWECHFEKGKEVISLPICLFYYFIITDETWWSVNFTCLLHPSDQLVIPDCLNELD